MSLSISGVATKILCCSMNRPNRQLDLFLDRPIPSACRPIDIGELFDAYAACRRNKRRTQNALAFEVDYERRLLRLLEAINSGAWRPGRAVAFIVDRPVKREIFAAPFRDRVVHHLLFAKLNPLFERAFIYDSYSCRIGKGTHLGIRRLDRFIRSCSLNYTRQAYVLKLDIRGFFMSISRTRLYGLLEAFLLERYREPDLPLVLDLVRKVVFHDPASHCVLKGSRSDWDGLPPDKSLFSSRPGCGLPIGNLTSQLFANFYLNGFDHYLKHDLGLRWYGRYVDDAVVVHHDRAFLQSLVPVVRRWLLEELGLRLHERKTRLLDASEGVPWLGTLLKPHRILIADRTKGNCLRAVERYNRLAEEHKPNRAERRAFQSTINAYLGLMKPYRTHTLRQRVVSSRVSPRWRRLVRPDARFCKVSLRSG
jgi:retron-type reverse transcriptase